MSNYIVARIVNTPDDGIRAGDLITGSMPEFAKPISKAEYEKSLGAVVGKLKALGAQVQVFKRANFPCRA